MQHILVVGLGNPGIAYNDTRHNIGFSVIDKIAEEFSFPQFTTKFSSLISSKILNHNKITLIKPQSFMNLSGDPLSRIMHFYKLDLENVIVIHDDLDLAFMKIKMKRGGGAGGHNGIKSIDSHLGLDYYRLRIGIGKPTGQKDVSNFVLEKFSSEEEKIVQQVMNNIIDNFEIILSKDMPNFMNKMSMEHQKYGI